MIHLYLDSRLRGDDKSFRDDMSIGNYSGSIFPLCSRDVATTDGWERRGQGYPFPKKQRENKLPEKIVTSIEYIYRERT
jgi:hypothetical protein